MPDEADKKPLRESLRDLPALRHTILRLEQDAHLSAARAGAMRTGLEQTVHDSTYVVGHLGAHLGIAAFRVWFPLLPIGSLARSLWVAGSRLVETVRGRPERARVHSATVFVVALIPFLGYCAYVVALRRVSEDAAYLYLNHVSYSRNGESFDVFLARRPGWVQRAGRRWLMPQVGGSAEG